MTTLPRRNSRTGRLAMALLSIVAPIAHAQDGSPSPSPAEIKKQAPDAGPIDRTRHTVVVPGRRTSRPLMKGGQVAMPELRVLSISGGEARIVDGVEPPRTIRRGDTLRGDVVREVGDGRIVLTRVEKGGESSTVIITVDRERVTTRVVRVKPDSQGAPQVK